MRVPWPKSRRGHVPRLVAFVGGVRIQSESYVLRVDVDAVAAVSRPGAALGGWMASRGVRRAGGGRIRKQYLGLVRAAPFVLLVGSSSSVGLLIVGLVGAGLCK